MNGRWSFNILKSVGQCRRVSQRGFATRSQLSDILSSSATCPSQSFASAPLSHPVLLCAEVRWHCLTPNLRMLSSAVDASVTPDTVAASRCKSEEIVRAHEAMVGSRYTVASGVAPSGTAVKMCMSEKKAVTRTNVVARRERWINRTFSMLGSQFDFE